MSIHKHNNRPRTSAYIYEGVYFNITDSELPESQYVFYPTQRSKDGLKTYLDYCNREDRKMMKLPEW